MDFFTPFEMPTGASIPDRSVCITDFDVLIILGAGDLDNYTDEIASIINSK